MGNSTRPNDAVDALYVEAIQTHLGGFIPFD